MNESSHLRIDGCTRQDFDAILREHAFYWENDLTLPLHHPIFLHEFGDTAFVVRDGDVIAAYLLGFVAQTGPVAYVHMVAVRDGHRRKGYARRLYEHFADVARRRGCTHMKATASPLNHASIRFHRSMGMAQLGEPNADGVPVVKDYLKPGVDRVVFWKSI